MSGIPCHSSPYLSPVMHNTAEIIGSVASKLLFRILIEIKLLPCDQILILNEDAPIPVFSLLKYTKKYLAAEI